MQLNGLITLSTNFLKYIRRIWVTGVYIVFVLLLNTAFVYLPYVHVGANSFSTAEPFVGFIYVMRDFAQREIGHFVILAMCIAAFLSYMMADYTIALASTSAFLVGEFIDWAIFTYTRKPLSQRILLSSTISSPIDSFVFLYVFGHFTWFEMTLMTLLKIGGATALWYSWKIKAKRAAMEASPA